MQKFHCIDSCSDCCIYRTYYPSKEYGKIGVLLLPEEKKLLEDTAGKLSISVTILPRIGVGINRNRNGPSYVLAYQMMGKEKNGDICPFLDLFSTKRSPHGGYNCSIYESRPIACRTYPLLEQNKQGVVLDDKCSFCKQKSNYVLKKGMEKELDLLRLLKSKMNVNEDIPIWRYATGIGDEEDKDFFYPVGWRRI